jgi:hypothetical protein
VAPIARSIAAPACLEVSASISPAVPPTAREKSVVPMAVADNVAPAKKGWNARKEPVSNVSPNAPANHAVMMAAGVFAAIAPKVSTVCKANAPSAPVTAIAMKAPCPAERAVNAIAMKIAFTEGIAAKGFVRFAPRHFPEPAVSLIVTTNSAVMMAAGGLAVDVPPDRHAIPFLSALNAPLHAKAKSVAMMPAVLPVGAAQVAIYAMTPVSASRVSPNVMTMCVETMAVGEVVEVAKASISVTREAALSPTAKGNAAPLKSAVATIASALVGLCVSYPATAARAFVMPVRTISQNNAANLNVTANSVETMAAEATAAPAKRNSPVSRAYASPVTRNV